MFKFLHQSSDNDAALADGRVYVQLADLIQLQHQARGFSFLPKQPVRSLLTCLHASRLRGRGLNFEELRHYRHGDDIRTMDWKVTNRTRKPHVRVYTEERERNVMLFIDQRINMLFGSEHKMKSVVAAEAAALIAWRVIASGDRVGAVIFNDDEVLSIKPGRTTANVMHILATIVSFNHKLRAGIQANPHQIVEAYKAVSRNLAHDALVISIGDGTGWTSTVTERVRKMARHNDMIAMCIVDAAEQQLPELYQFLVSDGVMQLEISGDKNDLRKKFQQQYQQEFGLMQQELKKFAIPVVAIDTVVPVQQQILQALGQPLKNSAARGTNR